MFDPLWLSRAEQIIRKVDRSESDELILRLWGTWEMNEEFWYPLDREISERPTHVEAFQDLYFEEELTHETVRQILFARDTRTLFEMREGGFVCEIEINHLHPSYTGQEGFWFTAQLDWVIYASHESSVTVGGEWLLAGVKRAWPNWKERVWTTPFYK